MVVNSLTTTPASPYRTNNGDLIADSDAGKQIFETNGCATAAQALSIAQAEPSTILASANPAAVSGWVNPRISNPHYNSHLPPLVTSAPITSFD